MHPHIGEDDWDERIEQAASFLRASTRVAVLTGAGISAESGLATFRGQGGLWEGHRVEEVATPRAFAQDARLVWRFYNQRRADLARVQPNAGHLALVDLERRFRTHFTLITQNVDGLHQAAGNQNVLEIHGSLRRVRCTGCGDISDRGLEPLPELPRCSICSALLRPDVVWFEEMLPQAIWTQAELAALRCQCFLVIGTSAMVYPAAGLIDLAHEEKARVIEVNLQATPATQRVDVALHGPSGTVLPQLVRACGKD